MLHVSVSASLPVSSMRLETALHPLPQCLAQSRHSANVHWMGDVAKGLDSGLTSTKYSYGDVSQKYFLHQLENTASLQRSSIFEAQMVL